MKIESLGDRKLTVGRKVYDMASDKELIFLARLLAIPVTLMPVIYGVANCEDNIPETTTNVAIAVVFEENPELRQAFQSGKFTVEQQNDFARNLLRYMAENPGEYDNSPTQHLS